MFLEDLFEKFLKQKTFIVGVSPKTIRSYQRAFNAYQRVLGKSSASSLDCPKGPDALPTGSVPSGGVWGSNICWCRSVISGVWQLVVCYD